MSQCLEASPCGPRQAPSPLPLDCPITLPWHSERSKRILPAASTGTSVQRALTTPLSDPAQKWRSQDLNLAPVTVELGRHSSLPPPHLLSLNLKPSLHRGLISRQQSTPNLSSFSTSLRSADVSPDVLLLSSAPFPKATATCLHPGPPVPPPPPASVATPSPPLARALAVLVARGEHPLCSCLAYISSPPSSHHDSTL